LGCHQQWSHTIECASCHELKNETNRLAATIDKKVHTGMEHPRIKPPNEVIYDTHSEEGRLITFYHDEHVKLFGLECVDCHQNENCSKCHDLQKEKFFDQRITTKIQTGESNLAEVHQGCYACHMDTRCNQCHAEKQKERFNHKVSAGWDLQENHRNVNCRTCHGNQHPFTKLDKNCIHCHENWQVGQFNHNVTGLILDETHIKINCKFCHYSSMKPTCEICHEGKKYPLNKPGRLIEEKK
jgi:hypothetical protein